MCVEGIHVIPGSSQDVDRGKDSVIPPVDTVEVVVSLLPGVDFSLGVELDGGEDGEDAEHEETLRRYLRHEVRLRVDFVLERVADLDVVKVAEFGFSAEFFALVEAAHVLVYDGGRSCGVAKDAA